MRRPMAEAFETDLEADKSRPRNPMAAFEAKMASAAVKNDRTPVALARRLDVHSNQASASRIWLLDDAGGVFGQEKSAARDDVVDLKAPRAKIGELAAGQGKSPSSPLRPGRMQYSGEPFQPKLSIIQSCHASCPRARKAHWRVVSRFPAAGAEF
jgi:hypothetical protein